ncbi:hypothetical protein GCM10010218_31250 [Streptomyces mashuensis]|uniref:Uncharacterized protein n=1 Tax=Streptomyces mashuensis TaxID=33904 RepID=A0A919EDR7_9ACTN|nr:hypothetical protein [Streptomyces mashuensis]GHF47598.1 hypothetical protein GCM10010218_31250 [Streptomyces mashuensis]
MRRHEFDPGKLLVGLVLLAGGLAYFGRADGWWTFPFFLAVPIMLATFCVGGALSALAFAARRRRARRVEGGGSEQAAVR